MQNKLIPLLFLTVSIFYTPLFAQTGVSGKTGHSFNGVYKGANLDMIAFPIGGIGAGMFCIEGTGTISHLSIRNKPCFLYGTPLHGLRSVGVMLVAVIATALTAFAFKSSNRFQSATLAIWNDTSYRYTFVPCARNGHGNPCNPAGTTVTYYTRISHTNVGTSAKFTIN